MTSADRLIVRLAKMYVKGIMRSKITYYGLFVTILVLVCSYCSGAAQYEYKGVFPIQNVMLEFCDDCWLELPPDYLAGSVVLSVTTDNREDLFKAVKRSSAAQGWNLTRKGKLLKAEPIQNVGNLVFISCMDNAPRNVEKYLYAASVRADSIQCAKRDSLLAYERSRADSVERERKRIDDSVKNVPPIGFEHYELRYYSYSKSFTDKMGLEWQNVLAIGNLHNRFNVFDDWRLFATENNDTTYNERRLVFTLDTSMNVDWGTEEQTMQKSYLTDGVVTQDFEWRKYGLIVKIRRDGRRIIMDYIFRDKDYSVSVLQGSVVGLDSDTLRIFGDYLAKREINSGLPILSKIPIVNWFVATQTKVNDLKAFELYLVPIQREKKNAYGRIKKNGQLYEPSTDTTETHTR